MTGKDKRVCRRGRRFGAAVAMLLTVGAWTVDAQADRRSYVWTYEYQTKPPGGTEFEHYLTSRINDFDAVDRAAWEQRFELEIGLTERWDVSIYQIFSQPADGAFRYDAFQVRTRYRLGEAGMWPVDPLLYLEYRRPSDLLSPHEIEGKLILARDIQRLNVALNIIEELKLAPGTEWETGYTLGLSFEPNPVLKVGAEAFGDIVTNGRKAHYFGPTVSVARAGWYYTVGLGFGLNNAADDLRARALLGVDL